MNYAFAGHTVFFYCHHQLIIDQYGLGYAFSAAVTGYDGTGWKGSWIGSWRYYFLELIEKKRGQIFIINGESGLFFWPGESIVLDFLVTPRCISVL